MRLYVNKNEIEGLKFALRNSKPADDDMRQKQLQLLERVVICENLQHNIERADAK